MNEISPPKNTQLAHLPPRPPHAVVEVSAKGLVEAFLSGRNPRTIRAYRNDVEDFKRFLGAEKDEEAVQLLLSQDAGKANALVYSYRAHLVDRQLSAATVNRRLAALKSLVKLGRLVGLVSFSVEVEGVPDEPYRDTRGPGRDGVSLLLEELKGKTEPKARRDFAILRLLYDVALRRGEVVSLDLSHLDLSKKTLSIKGKGRHKRQLLSLPDPTRDALAAWIRVRGKEPGPLFTSFDRAEKGDGRLRANGIYDLVKKLGLKLGLKVRPHGLRHAAITDALDATSGNVRAVQKFSRHKDLRVLCVYDDARQDLAGEVARLVARRT